MTARRWEPITRQFRYIFYAFFQPARLEREIRPTLRWQRLIFMLKLTVPMFLVAYLLTLAGEMVLLPFGLLKYPDVLGYLLVPMIGIAGGVTFGIIDSVLSLAAVYVVDSIIVGTAFGIMVGIAVGTTREITFGIVVGAVFSLINFVFFIIRDKNIVNYILGILDSMVFGVLIGVAFGILGNSAGILLFGLAFGFSGGLVNKNAQDAILIGIGVGIGLGVVIVVVGVILVGIVFGIVFGTTFAIATIIGFILGLYSIPLYLISGPSTLYTYFASRQRPRDALGLLRHSSLHWDERVYLPLPFLKQTLLIAYDQNLQGTLEEIAFIAAERRQQLRAARAVVLEIVMREMEGRKTIQEIAGASLRLNELLPPEMKLSDPLWSNALPRLSDASREMMRSMQPIGRQARLKSLDKVIKSLDKVRPNMAFSDQDLNKRLKLVIETWLAAARTKREELQHAAQDIGNIDNPYKPGQVLEPDDPLFVGRRDLAVQLEYALSKGSRRPTLLLQGERRMGKTSTLLQLSHLLGTNYIPVVCNLQDPKIYARITTFLGTLANDVYDELSRRGIKVKQMPFALLLESAQTVKGGDSYQGRDPEVYDIFDRWLKKVEAVLEKEDRSLLLAFDEFEKLDEAGEKGYLDLSLFLDWCRQVIQYRPNIILLFSGVRTFSNMGEKTGLNWSNYFVNVQTLKVSFLNVEEARQLVLHPRSGYPSEEIFVSVVEQIIQQTNCHPFLVQAICSQLIDTLNVEKRERVEVDDVTGAVKQVIESWDGYFDDLWKRCDEPQRNCLLALDTQEGEEGMTLDDIQQRGQLDGKSIRQVLRTLVSRDLVIDNDDGTYRIAAPIFRRWVKYNS